MSIESKRQPAKPALQDASLTGENTSVFSQDVLESRMSRRHFLRRTGEMSLGAGAILFLAGCGTEEEEGTAIEKLMPQTEAQNVIYPLMQRWNTLRNAADVDSQGASLLTQAANRIDNETTTLEDYKFYLEQVKATDIESTILTNVSYSASMPRDQVGGMFLDAQNRLKDAKKEGHAINITSLAANTGADVPTVLSQYQLDLPDESEQLAIQPVKVAAKLLNVDQAKIDGTEQRISQEQIADPKDKAALLYSAIFTDALFDDILADFRALEKDELGPNVRGDLLLATLLNNHDFQGVTEMYDFAGQLKGMTQEAAAKLVLASVIERLENDPTLADEIDGAGAPDQENPAPSGSTHTSFVYFPYGGYYWNSYDAYNHSSTRRTGFTKGKSTSGKPGRGGQAGKPSSGLGKGGSRGGMSGGKGSGTG